MKNLLKLAMHTESHFHGLPINASKSNPVYLSYLENTYDQLTKLLALYYRCVVVRVDLHLPSSQDTADIGSSEPVSKLIKSVRAMVMRKYRSEMAYQWVREYGEKSHNSGPHWHLWIACKKTNSQQAATQARHLQFLIAEQWHYRVPGGRSHFAGWFYLDRNELSIDARNNQHFQLVAHASGPKPLCNMPLSGIRSRQGPLRVHGGRIDECFYALSYLSKVYTKIRHKEQQKLTSTSRLCCPSDRQEILCSIHKQLTDKAILTVLEAE